MISYQSVTNRSIIAAPFPVLLVFRQKNNLFFLSKAHAAVLGISLQTNRDSRHASFNGTGYLCKQKNKTDSNLLQKNKNRQNPFLTQTSNNPLKYRRTRYKNKTSKNPLKNTAYEKK